MKKPSRQTCPAVLKHRFIARLQERGTILSSTTFQHPHAPDAVIQYSDGQYALCLLLEKNDLLAQQRLCSAQSHARWKHWGLIVGVSKGYLEAWKTLLPMGDFAEVIAL